MGNVPYQMTVVLLSSNQFMGEKSSDPFVFKRHGLNRAILDIDGLQIESNFDNNNLFGSYYRMMGSLKEPNAHLSFDQYKKTCFCLHYDLSLDSNKCHLRTVRRSNARLTLTFNESTSESITLLAIVETPQFAEVDQSRKVIVK